MMIYSSSSSSKISSSTSFWACLPALAAEASSLPVESTMSFAEPSSCEYDVTCCDAPLNGSLHRFSAEISMGIQHKIGADIMFAFDELTTLM